jgi:hypothetical protein
LDPQRRLGATRCVERWLRRRAILILTGRRPTRRWCGQDQAINKPPRSQPILAGVRCGGFDRIGDSARQDTAAGRRSGRCSACPSRQLSELRGEGHCLVGQAPDRWVRGYQFQKGLTRTHDNSQHLTWLAPQPPHKPAYWQHCPWSDGFDRIFRNEGVTGSNPVSSTESPGQGPVLDRLTDRQHPSLDLWLHRRPTRVVSRSTSFCARCFLTPPHVMCDEPGLRVGLGLMTATH